MTASKRRRVEFRRDDRPPLARAAGEGGEERSDETGEGECRDVHVATLVHVEARDLPDAILAPLAEIGERPAHVLGLAAVEALVVLDDLQRSGEVPVEVVLAGPLQPEPERAGDAEAHELEVGVRRCR